MEKEQDILNRLNKTSLTPEDVGNSSVDNSNEEDIQNDTSTQPVSFSQNNLDIPNNNVIIPAQYNNDLFQKDNNKYSNQNAIDLLRAIRLTETTNNYNAVGKAGEIGGYQFLPSTYFALTGKPLAQATPDEQDETAYAYVISLIQKGYTGKQISGIWNAGEPNFLAMEQGKAPKSKKDEKGNVKYDVGAYQLKVENYFNQILYNRANQAEFPIENKLQNKKKINTENSSYIDRLSQDFDKFLKNSAEFNANPKANAGGKLANSISESAKLIGSVAGELPVIKDIAGGVSDIVKEISKGGAGSVAYLLDSIAGTNKYKDFKDALNQFDLDNPNSQAKQSVEYLKEESPNIKATVEATVNAGALLYPAVKGFKPRVLTKDLVENDVYNSFKENFAGSSKASTNKYLDSIQKTGIDPLKILSKDPELHPQIVKDTTKDAYYYDFTNAKDVLNDKIKKISQARDDLFKRLDENPDVPAIKKQDVSKDILDTFKLQLDNEGKISFSPNSPYYNYLQQDKTTVLNALSQYMKSLDEGANIKNEVVGIADSGDITRMNLLEKRKNLDANIESITKTNLKEKLLTDIRKVYKNQLEKSVDSGDVNLIKNTNQEISTYKETLNFLEKGAINNKPIKGGAFTRTLDKVANKGVGATAGAVVGSGIGGIPGGVIGAGIGGAVLDSVLNAIKNKGLGNILASSADREILQKLIEKNPNFVELLNNFDKK